MTRQYSGIYRTSENPKHRYMVSCEVSGGSRVYTVEADTPEEACDLVKKEVLAPWWHGDVWAEQL